MPRIEEVCAIFLNHVFYVVGSFLHYRCSVRRIIITSVHKSTLPSFSPLLRKT
jgi:hypothetical protein